MVIGISERYLIYGLIIVGGYLIGSIPFAVIIGNLKKINIKKVGSKNPGAANVTHSLGFKYGLLVGILDTLKSAIPVFLVNYYLTVPGYILVLLSVSLIFGHNYSVFLHFNGGKGVSTSMGVIIALTPISYFIGIVVLVIFTIKRQIAPGMLVFFSLIPLLNYFLYRNAVYTSISAIILLILIFRRITCTSNYSKKAIFNKFLYDNEEKTVAKLVF